MPKRALVISFNWETKEILFQDFEGDGAAKSAEEWGHPKSFIRRDFPAKDGWEHIVWWNKEAGEERAQQVVDALSGNGEYVLSIPR